MSQAKNTAVSKQLRGLIVLAGLLATTTANLEPTAAQDIGGNVEQGRALARAWCAECHRVEEGTVGVFAGDFSDVANLSSTTALSLRVFLQSNHKQMPNLHLKPAEIDDIVAYILSLKGR